jgi:hypothetical protein
MHNRTRTPTHNHTRRHSRAHTRTNTRTRTHAHTHALLLTAMHGPHALGTGRRRVFGLSARKPSVDGLIGTAAHCCCDAQCSLARSLSPQRCAALISEIVLRTGTPVVAIDYRRPPVLTGYSVLTAYSQGTRCLRVYWYVLAVILPVQEHPFPAAQADGIIAYQSCAAPLRHCCRVPLAIISWECRRRPCEAPMPRGPTMMRGIPG